MKFTLITCLALLSSASASVLSDTDVATVLKTVTDQSTLTIPAAANAVFAKLGAGGANAASVTAAESAVIDKCVTDARNNNEASKAGLGGGTGSAGNIVFVTAKTTLHACQTAQQQIAVSKGKTASDTSVNLFISNVGVLNANIKARDAKAKRAVPFQG